MIIQNVGLTLQHLLYALIVAVAAYIIREVRRWRMAIRPRRPELTIDQAWQMFSRNPAAGPDVRLIALSSADDAHEQAERIAQEVEDASSVSDNPRLIIRQGILANATTALQLAAIAEYDEGARQALIRGYEPGMDGFLKLAVASCHLMAPVARLVSVTKNGIHSGLVARSAGPTEWWSVHGLSCWRRMDFLPRDCKSSEDRLAGCEWRNRFSRNRLTGLQDARDQEANTYDEQTEKRMLGEEGGRGKDEGSAGDETTRGAAQTEQAQRRRRGTEERKGDGGENRQTRSGEKRTGRGRKGASERKAKAKQSGGSSPAEVERGKGGHRGAERGEERCGGQQEHRYVRNSTHRKQELVGGRKMCGEMGGMVS